MPAGSVVEKEMQDKGIAARYPNEGMVHKDGQIDGCQEDGM